MSRFRDDVNVIPPQSNARIREHGITRALLHPRAFKRKAYYIEATLTASSIAAGIQIIKIETDLCDPS